MDIAYIVNLRQFTSIYFNSDTFACPKFQGRVLCFQEKKNACGMMHALVTKKVHIVNIHIVNIHIVNIHIVNIDRMSYIKDLVIHFYSYYELY